MPAHTLTTQTSIPRKSFPLLSKDRLEKSIQKALETSQEFIISLRQQITYYEDGVLLLRVNKTQDQKAAPWLKRLVAGLSPRRPAFDPRSAHMGFVVDKVTPVQVFLTVLLPRQYHFTNAP
jgi:hypothetical protein